MKTKDEIYNAVVISLGELNVTSGPFIIQSYADQELERYKERLKTEIEAHGISGIISKEAMRSILDIIETTEVVSL